MDDPDICAQCASKQPTCCQIPLGQEESCFPLSPGERQKLERHNAFIPGPRFAKSVHSKKFLRNLHRLFPQDKEILQRLFPQDILHHRLALTANGCCVFLGPRGCVVSVEDRPYYCRIYPFWFVGKRFFRFAPTACLAVQTTPSPNGLCSLFNTSQSALRELYAHLRLSWGLDDILRRG